MISGREFTDVLLRRHQNRRTIATHFLCLGINKNALVSFLPELSEAVRFGDFHAAGAANNQGFQILTSHHSAKSGTPCGSGAIDHDGRGSNHMLARWANGCHMAVRLSEFPSYCLTRLLRGFSPEGFTLVKLSVSIND